MVAAKKATVVNSLDLAISLIKRFEGCHLEAYPDPLSGGKPYTVGYGSTRDLGGNEFKNKQRITQDYAELLLDCEIDSIEATLSEDVPYWKEMSPEQQACLISFAYNLGSGFMVATTGFETIQRLLKQKKWDEVPKALLLYRNPGSNVEEGLLRRRQAEGELWIKGMNNPSQKPISITALRDTWLKKTTGQASSLPNDQKKQVISGKTYQVISWKESPADRAHIQVELDYGAGVWLIYSPDWSPWGSEANSNPPSTNHKDFDAKVSEFFTWGEVWQWDSRRITDDQDILLRIRKLAAELDKLRRQFGPISVTSWYRPPAINAAVGGVSNSQHLQGHAADIYVTTTSGQQFEDWLVNNWQGGVGKGIASGRGFTHVDLGPRRVWNY